MRKVLLKLTVRMEKLVRFRDNEQGLWIWLCRRNSSQFVRVIAVCRSVVPGLEVGVTIVLGEEEAAPQLCQLVLSLLTQPEEKLTPSTRGVFDLVRFRHHETGLGVDAGQDGVLGPGDGVLALSSQQDIAALETVERLGWRLQLYDVRQGRARVSTVVLTGAPILLLHHPAADGRTGRPGVWLHFDSQASFEISPQ